MGAYHAAAKFAAISADERGGPRETLARLKGVRYVTIIESNEDRQLDEATVKSITGGDNGHR